MIVVVAGLGLLAILVWAGRRSSPLAREIRLGSALFAAFAAVGAVVAALRGGWPESLILIGLAAYLGQTARGGGGSRTVGQAGVGGRMTPREARSILGVNDIASRADIEEAYRRLIRRAHPDHGGSAGLAAQINAARDCLLGD